VPVFPPTPNVRLMLPRSRLVFSRTVQLLASLFRRCNSTWIIHQYVTDAKCILLSFLGAEKLIRGVAWVDFPKKNEGSRKSLAPWKRKIECNLKRKRFAKPEIAIQNKKKMPYYRRIGWYSGPCPPFLQRWRRGLVLAFGSDRYGILLVPLSTEEVKLKKLDTSIFMDSHLFFSDHWNKTMTTCLTSSNLQKFVKFQNPTLATKITLGDRPVP